MGLEGSWCVLIDPFSCRLWRFKSSGLFCESFWFTEIGVSNALLTKVEYRVWKYELIGNRNRKKNMKYLEIKTQHTIQEKKLFQILQLQNFKIQPLIIIPSPINISTWLQIAGLDQEWSRGAIGNTAQVAHPRDSENNAITTTVTSQPYLPDKNQA